MATIARLVVAMGGDNAELQRVFVDSATRAQKFATDVKKLMDGTKFVPPPMQLDTGRLEEYKAELRNVNEALAEFTHIRGNLYRDTVTGGFASSTSGNLGNLRAEQAQYEQLIATENAEIAQYRESVAEKISLGQKLAVENAKVFGEGAVRAAQEYVKNLKTTMDAELSQVRESEARGLFTTPQQAAQAGKLVAVSYNEALLQSLDDLAGMGLGESVYREVTTVLQSALSKAGVQAGRELGVGMASGIDQSTQLISQAGQRAIAPFIDSTKRMNTAVTTAEGTFTSFGRRGSTALIGLGFGMESFANGTESGMRRALRSVETFALFFGPEGLMLAGIITVGLAIFDFFEKAAKKAEETAKRMSSAIEQAANAGDQVGLEKVYRDLTQGTPTQVLADGSLEIHKRSQFALNAFEGGAADYQGRINRLQSQLDAATTDRNAALVGVLKVKLEQLKAEAAPVLDQTRTVYDLLMNPPAQFRMPERNKPITTSAKGPKVLAADAVRDQAAEIGGLVKELELARKSGANYTGTLERLGDMLGVLGDVRLRRSGESWETWTRRVGEAEQITRAIDGLASTIHIPTPTIDMANLVPDFLGPASQSALANSAGITTELDTLLEKFKTFKQNVASQNIIGSILDPKGFHPNDGEVVLGPLRTQIATAAEDIRSRLASALNDPKLAPTAKLIFTQVAEALKVVGKAADDTADKMGRVASAAQKAGEYLRGAGDIASATGNQQMGQILSTAGDLATNAGDAIASGGMDISADVKTITSAISLGNELQGDAKAIRKENNSLLRQNSEHLAEVSFRLQGFTTNASTSTTAQQALQAFFANAGAVNQFASGATHSGGFLGTGKVGDLQTEIDALTPFLQSVGMTYEQFKKIVSDQGWAIFDSQGRIVTETLRQMANGMDTVTKSAFTYNKTLSDQTQLSNLNLGLGNFVTPQAQLKSSVGVLETLAPNLVPGLGGLNLDTQAGQNDLRSILQTLVGNVAAGNVATADFGKLQNLNDFNAIITTITGSLNTLRDTTDGLNETIQNITPGFKLRLDTFDATEAVGRAPGLMPPPLLPTGSNGQPVAPSPTPVAPTPTSITFQLSPGAIQVVGYESPKDAAKTILDGMQDLAAERLGNRAQWAQLN